MEINKNFQTYGIPEWYDIKNRLYPTYTQQNTESWGAFKKPKTVPKIPDSRILLHETHENSASFVFEVEHALVLISTGNGGTTLTVSSEDIKLSESLNQRLGKKFCVQEDESATRVRSDFWYWNGQSTTRSIKYLDVFPWADIRQNYNASVVGKVDEMIKLDEAPDSGSGRMIVLHGPPGTGKTNLIRAIASEWHKWALPSVVLDPENMLNMPGYMLEVASSIEGDQIPLIVMEDAGELVKTGSKGDLCNGQMISRLLNMADGLATQWTKALFLITTNEVIADLDNALTRAGRCLAHIEIGALSSEEATTWLGQPVEHDTVLADLYAQKNAGEVIQHRDSDHYKKETGLYL